MLYYLGKGTEFKKEDCKEYKTIEGAMKAAAKDESFVVWDENGNVIGSLTDNVPEGALQTNPDGSVNTYDADGNKVGTVDAETVEKMKNVSIYLYTGNMRAGLKAAGFEVLTENKYLTSDAYLLEGDITLNDNAHVAVNLTDGAKSSGTGASNTTTVKSNAKVDVAHGFNKSLAGTYKVTASGLNLRAGAGTGKSILAVMKNGEKVQCYGYYNDCNGVKWLYVVYKNIVGYASSKYLSK